MASFTVTEVSSTVVVDAFRHGHASFTVHSEASSLLRARARPVAIAPSQPGWFQVRGAAEQAIAPGATIQVVVDIAVPAGAAFGRYLFRLDVVGLENPDEDSAHSSAVAFEIRSATPQPSRLPQGYRETLAGSAIGGVAAGAVGAVPSAIFALASGGRATITGVQTVLLVGALAGSWIGAALGAWISLRIQGFEGAPQTGMALGIAYPVAAAPLAFAGVKLWGALGVLLAALVFLCGPALLARFLYLRMLRHQA